MLNLLLFSKFYAIMIVEMEIFKCRCRRQHRYFETAEEMI